VCRSCAQCSAHRCGPVQNYHGLLMTWSSSASYPQVHFGVPNRNSLSETRHRGRWVAAHNLAVRTLQHDRICVAPRKQRQHGDGDQCLHTPTLPPLAEPENWAPVQRRCGYAMQAPWQEHPDTFLRSSGFRSKLPSSKSRCLPPNSNWRVLITSSIYRSLLSASIDLMMKFKRSLIKKPKKDGLTRKSNRHAIWTTDFGALVSVDERDDEFSAPQVLLSVAQIQKRRQPPPHRNQLQLMRER